VEATGKASGAHPEFLIQRRPAPLELAQRPRPVPGTLVQPHHPPVGPFLGGVVFLEGGAAGQPGLDVVGGLQ
jgi:hypothetical protein